MGEHESVGNPRRLSYAFVWSRVCPPPMKSWARRRVESDFFPIANVLRLPYSVGKQVHRLRVWPLKLDLLQILDALRYLLFRPGRFILNKIPFHTGLFGRPQDGRHVH